MHNEFNLAEYADTIKEVLAHDGVFRIYPKGTSMMPLIRQKKDSVVLTAPKFPMSKGDIIFYQRKNGQFVLHRIVKKTGDTYVCCGDNQVQLEPGIDKSMIIAVVEAIYRKDKKVDNKNLAYRLYLFVWQFFLIRRIVWKLRRLFGGKKTK